MAHEIARNAMPDYHVDIKQDDKKSVWHYKSELRFKIAIDNQQYFNNREKENADSIPDSRQWNLPTQDTPYEMHRKYNIHDYFNIAIIIISSCCKHNYSSLHFSSIFHFTPFPMGLSRILCN